jgi:hypothetical protein
MTPEAIAKALSGQGRHVRIARPPQGLDFNDVLLGRTSRIQESTQ